MVFFAFFASLHDQLPFVDLSYAIKSHKFMTCIITSGLQADKMRLDVVLKKTIF
jgi:hypothetical protein